MKHFFAICFVIGIWTCIAPNNGKAQTNTIVVPAGELNPGSTGSFPSELTVFGNALFFNASTPSLGKELWLYQDSRITLVSNINDNFTLTEPDQIFGHDSSPAGMTVYNGALYFSAYDERRGGELWRTDGTNAVRAADIYQDANDDLKSSPASSWPKELTVIGNFLFFPATTSVQENYELWKFDGVSATMVTNIHPDSGNNRSSYPNNLVTWNGALYFQADDGNRGFELWKHDGVRATLLADINSSNSQSSSYPKFFTPFNNRLYFQAYTPVHGFELWTTDGTNTLLAKDIFPGNGDSTPEFLTVFEEALYFRASEPAGGSELWKFDGTNAVRAADINPFGDSFPKNLTRFQNKLCFAANDGVNGWELWSYDGTAASLVTDLNPSGDSFPEQLTVIDETLYFVATTPETGYELWKYDGVGVTLVHEINVGPGHAYPLNLAVFDKRLCFSATDDGFSNWELWTVITTTNGYLGIAPLIDFSVTGEVGGLFSPSSQQYTLTNMGPAALTWAASNVPPWLSVTATSGTLPGETSVLVTLSPNANVNLLSPGTYVELVHFINTSTGGGNTALEAKLDVLSPLAITKATMLNGELILQFPTQNGGSYTVEHTDSLLSYWTELTTIAGTGGVITVTNSNPPADQRFYRLRQQ